ncbi:putative Beta-1,3-glucan-binding protein [Daphnia magna]|uniref:Putative Beta-1,3-glucan-binding protein n=1 Tax=Daphnia magna TaxID=35525 RepID=A0A162QLJ1_9CRUS|nr:putative Beta-1,3-glucan-binding protein [Daphnia magna]
MRSGLYRAVAILRISMSTVLNGCQLALHLKWSQTVGSLSPPAGGFWELSGLTGANPWTKGTRMAPFDQKFHLVLNVAVGAVGFFPEGCENVPYDLPWAGSSDTDAHFLREVVSYLVQDIS